MFENGQFPVPEMEISEDIRGTVISDIPNDGKAPFAMTAILFDDLWLQIIDYNELEFVPLNPIRFRTLAGGGLLPFVPAQLSLIGRSIKENGGEIPHDYEDLQIKELIEEKYNVPFFLDIEESDDPDKPRISVKGIPDDEGNADNRYINKMDIEVAHDGTVTVRLRENVPFNIPSDESTRRLYEKEMEFKNAENGGRNPVIAFAFTKVAERFLAVKNKTLPT